MVAAFRYAAFLLGVLLHKKHSPGHDIYVPGRHRNLAGKTLPVRWTLHWIAADFGLVGLYTLMKFAANRFLLTFSFILLLKVR